MHLPPFDPDNWNGIDLAEEDRVSQSSTHIRFRMTRSRWEGTTFLHSKRCSDDNGDGTWTLRFAPDHDFKMTDGTHTIRVTAAEFFEDRTSPLPQPGTFFAVPHAFDPRGWSEVRLSESDALNNSYGNPKFRLIRSKWEGATFEHPAKMTTQQEDGSWKLSFPSGWAFKITDGRYIEGIPAREFFEDRTNPLPQPAEPYRITPEFFPQARNGFDISAVNVTANESGRSVTVMLTHSQWEGLHFTHPVSMCVWQKDGSVTIRFEADWEFKLLGGESAVPVSRQALWQDRVTPRAEPGASLAVEQTEWLSVVFHEAYLKKIVNQWGTSWRIRFPWASKHPGAVVFHPKKLTREIKGNPELLAFRFHEEWTFKLKDRDGGELEMTATGFVEATEAWAGRRPERTRGIARLEPTALDPVANVQVHADLLAPIHLKAA